MQIMKRLLIKNKRKLWLWFLLLVFLFLACRAAYITGSKAEQTRNNEVEERQAVVGQYRMKWRYYVESISRTELLLGKEAMNKLENSRVAVFGIGGVGGYVCEALVRSGVGTFDLIDDDKVCLTNLNRQIIATRKTVGQYKTEVMRDRILDINPKADVRIHNCFIFRRMLLTSILVSMIMW